MLTFKILELRDFRRLWIGQVVSQFGDAMYFLIFLYMVDRITQNPAIVGAVAVVQAVPYLLFSAWAGALADRLDRRVLMVFSDVGSAALLFLFAILLQFQSTPPLWSIFAVAFGLAFCNVFFAPARGAALPRLVPPDRLMEANSLSAGTQHLMPLLSLGLSASVLGVVERQFPERFFLAAVLINAISFVFSASCLARLPKIVPMREEHHETHVWRDMKEGFTWIRQSAFLRTALGLTLGLNFFIGPFMLVYLAANRDWFGGRYWTLATIEAAFVAMMLIFSLLMPRFRIDRPGMALIGGLVASGVLVALMGVTPYFVPFLIWNIVCGAMLPFANLPMQAYLQRTVPDAYMGRVQSAFAMVASVAVPVANGIAGPLLGTIGIQGMFWIMGLGLSIAAAVGVLSPAFRRARFSTLPPIEVPSEAEADPESGHSVVAAKS